MMRTMRKTNEATRLQSKPVVTCDYIEVPDGEPRIGERCRSASQTSCSAGCRARNPRTHQGSGGYFFFFHLHAPEGRTRHPRRAGACTPVPPLPDNNRSFKQVS